MIAGKRAFIAVLNGDIHALDLATGKSAWSFEAGSQILASPAIADGRMVIGTADGQLYCFGGK